MPVSREHFARLRHHDDNNVTDVGDLYLSDEVVDAWGQCLRLTGPRGEATGVHMWASSLVWKYLGYRVFAPVVEDVRRVVLRLQRDGVDLMAQRAWVLPRVP